jgi:hypothetical protein
MTGSLAFDGAVGNAIGSLIRDRSLSRSGGNILRSGNAAEAQMMTDWLCRQGEHGKIDLEDTQTAVERCRATFAVAAFTFAFETQSSKQLSRPPTHRGADHRRSLELDTWL